jgi:hypothetical protein
VSGGYSLLTVESRVQSQASQLGIFGNKMALEQGFIGLRKSFPSCTVSATLHIHIRMHIFPATGKFVPSEVGEHCIENKLQYATTHVTMNPSRTMVGLFLLNEDDRDCNSCLSALED